MLNGILWEDKWSIGARKVGIIIAIPTGIKEEYEISKEEGNMA
jgi:hypothetical protein